MGKLHPESPAKLTDYKVLSFDVYSTLIDEPGGRYQALQPLLSQLATPIDRSTAISLFSVHEQRLQTTQPTLPYPQILYQSYLLLATDLSLPPPSPTSASTFASTLTTWPAFPDTVSALKTLSKHYKLVILSNIDNESIQKTISGPLEGVKFDAVYTAQQIGSYKPDKKNFEWLVRGIKEDLGIEKEGILHTAQSWRCDVVPGRPMGLALSWIDRQGEGWEGREKDGVGWRFESLGEMAEEAKREFGKLGGGE